MGIFFWPMGVRSLNGGIAATVQAMVDTGSNYTVLPGDLLRELGVEPTETRLFELGDGRIVGLETGPARIRIEDEEHARTVVFGEEGTTPLMGVDILQSTGFVVDPRGHRLLRLR